MIHGFASFILMRIDGPKEEGVMERGNLWDLFQLWVIIKKPAVGKGFSVC